MLLSDYISQVQFLIHDQTNADFSQAELIAKINNARTTVALDFNCVRDLYICPLPNAAPNSNTPYRPVSIIPGQEWYPMGLNLVGLGTNTNTGMIVGATMVNGGSGFTSQATCAFQTPPPGGIQAAGVPIVNANGLITGINMTQWGVGYVPALPGTSGVPIIAFNDPGGGINASAVPTMFNSVLNILSISALWGNQRYNLLYRGYTLFQAYWRSNINATQRPCVWTIHQQSGVVLVSPFPDQNYMTEWDVTSLPQPLAVPTDVDLQVLPPWSDAVQYWAAYLCLMKLQNFEQAKFMFDTYVARVPRIVIGNGGVPRIPNIYNKSFQRRVLR